MIKNNAYYEFFASYTVPNSDEVGYWVDLGADSKGKVIKVYNSNIDKWVKVTDVTSEDAVSPYIGSNGNWYVDNRDTGIPASGKNPYIGDNGNWWVYDALANDYIDTGVIAKGTSAYDIAVSNGFQGTEQEWLESLKEPAKEAAEEALKAAEAANEAADRVDEGLTSVNETIEEANTAIDNAEQATANAQEVAVNTPKIVDTYWYVYDLNTHQYVNTYVEAVGKSFKIVKSYPSEDALFADFDNPEVDFGEFVWIRTGNVEDEEDSRLYLKTEDGWDLVGDLSGMQGIEGQSAYEIAVEHGYVGSEDDWLQSIKQPALDAADVALAAKDEVLAAQGDIESAEAARVEAEKAREQAEADREAKEAVREQQEVTRQQNTAEAIEAAEEATNATEQAITEAETQADRAKAYADNPPMIGDNDRWFVWSEVTGSYLDTGVKATGIHGKSPYIEGGTWWVYNDDTDEYWDTSISVNSDYVLTKAKVENVLTGDIASHNHDSMYIKEAPADGKQYARKDSTWSEVVMPEVDLSKYLSKDNTTEFTPDADYEPATKKYVDDSVSTVNEDLQTSKQNVATNLNLKVDKIEGKQLSTNDYTNEEKSKLSGIAAGAEVNVNADWNATEGDAQILNKPNLSTVATSGSYNDLLDKPSVPTLDNTLTKDNTTPFTPTGEYNPTTKKYVDDELTGLSTEVDQKINSAIASVYRVKGSVANYESLPTTDVVIGDVYNLLDTGANYVATGSELRFDLSKGAFGNYNTIVDTTLTEDTFTVDWSTVEGSNPSNTKTYGYMFEDDPENTKYNNLAGIEGLVFEVNYDGEFTDLNNRISFEIEHSSGGMHATTLIQRLVKGINVIKITGNEELDEEELETLRTETIYGWRIGCYAFFDREDTYTIKELPSVVWDKLSETVDLSGYLTKADATNIYQPKGEYLTSIPSEYVTETELETTLTGKNYAIKTEIPTNVSQLVNDSNYATTTEVNQAITTADAPSDGNLYGKQNGEWTAIDLSDVPTSDNVLTKSNTTEYTPTGDYNPATKKYVDDSINSIVGEIVVEIPSSDSGSLTAGSFASLTEAVNSGITVLANIAEDGMYGVAKSIVSTTTAEVWLSPTIIDGKTTTYKYTINSDESYTRELIESDAADITNVEGIDSNWTTILQSAPTDQMSRWPTWDEVTSKPTFATVATTGSYTDLNSTPALSEVATTGQYDDLENIPNFANVAMSGSYGDLVNTPEMVTPGSVLTLNNTTEYMPSSDYNPATKKYVDDAVNPINSSLTSLQSFMDFYEGANTVSTLVSLPIDKRSIVANVGSATNLSLSGVIPVGRELYIRIYNTSSVTFDQPIPSTGAFHSMNGSSVPVQGYSWIEMSIWCYSEGNYSVRIGEIG